MMLRKLLLMCLGARVAPVPPGPPVGDPLHCHGVFKGHAMPARGALHERSSSAGLGIDGSGSTVGGD